MFGSNFVYFFLVKADKIAEQLKTEREKQEQQTREDELREMAIKLRRRYLLNKKFLLLFIKLKKMYKKGKNVCYCDSFYFKSIYMFLTLFKGKLQQ